MYSGEMSSYREICPALSDLKCNNLGDWQSDLGIQAPNFLSSIESSFLTGQLQVEETSAKVNFGIKLSSSPWMNTSSASDIEK